MYLTIKNIVLALCIGSIVAIVININLSADAKKSVNRDTASITNLSYNSLSNNHTGFDRTALAIGFFVFSALFVVKPIKARD